MVQSFVRGSAAVFVLCGFLVLTGFDVPAYPKGLQLAPANPTATLKAIHPDGVKHLTADQVIALAGLSIGSAVGKQELQAAADRLVQTGLFSNVNYAFQSKDDGLYLTLNLAEGPRVP